MKIIDHEAFRDAQSQAFIAYCAEDKNNAQSFWESAMKSLKKAYGVGK